MEEKVTVLSSEGLSHAVAQAVSSGGVFLLTVTGGSMVPALLHQKSQVELCSPENIRKRDIVLACRKDGSLVLHRVIRISGDALTLNGDAQDWTETVQKDQVLAKVLRLCRKGRWHTAHSLGDRVYCLLWGLLRPLRPALFRLYSKLRKSRTS